MKLILLLLVDVVPIIVDDVGVGVEARHLQKTDLLLEALQVLQVVQVHQLRTLHTPILHIHHLVHLVQSARNESAQLVILEQILTTLDYVVHQN